MRKFAVILPAAGQSRRFGGLEKKPFVSLGGRPIWQRSVEQFWNRSDVVDVLIVISPDDVDEFKSRFGHVLAFANARLVTGGSERFESVANALAKLSPEAEFVAVHDAVRPLVNQQTISRVFEAAIAHGAAIPGIPVADTLKCVNEKNEIVETVSREGLWAVQTPQAFRRDWIEQAYERRREFSSKITDDSQLIEAIGQTVHVVAGSPSNFKITTREDLTQAETLLGENSSARQESPSHLPFEDERQMW